MLSERYSNIINQNSPLNFMQEQVHNDWMILITSPCVEARIVGGPVDTRRDTRWNRYGMWLATETKHFHQYRLYRCYMVTRKV